MASHSNLSIPLTLYPEWPRIEILAHSTSNLYRHRWLAPGRVASLSLARNLFNVENVIDDVTTGLRQLGC